MEQNRLPFVYVHDVLDALYLAFVIRKHFALYWCNLK